MSYWRQTGAIGRFAYMSLPGGLYVVGSLSLWQVYQIIKNS